MSLALVENRNPAFSEAPRFKEEYSFSTGLQSIRDFLKLVPHLVTSQTVFVIAHEPLLKRAKAKLTGLFSLSDDWDSDGARPVPRIASVVTRDLLDLVEKREGLSELDSAAPFS